MYTPNILVVEDDPGARRALAEILRDAGYRVETAGNGIEGLGRATWFHPDVVLCDLQMPGLSGSELVAKLRSFADPPAVIAMTEFGAHNPAIAALVAGACDYVVKPLDVEELLVVLVKSLRQHAMEAENRELRAAARL